MGTTGETCPTGSMPIRRVAPPSPPRRTTEPSGYTAARPKEPTVAWVAHWGPLQSWPKAALARKSEKTPTARIARATARAWTQRGGAEREITANVLPSSVHGVMYAAVAEIARPRCLNADQLWVRSRFSRAASPPVVPIADDRAKSPTWSTRKSRRVATKWPDSLGWTR